MSQSCYVDADVCSSGTVSGAPCPSTEASPYEECPSLPADAMCYSGGMASEPAGLINAILY